jgi:hypothetical protein
MKPHSIYRETLIGVTLEFGGAAILMKLLNIRETVQGLFFFVERTATGMLYLDMLEEFLMPILEEDGPDDMLFQQDGAPPHFRKEMTDFLNGKFPEKRICMGGPITWPPRSPDLTPLEFFFREYINDAVHVTPFAITLPELAGRKIYAVATVTLDLLNNESTETKYRYDICRATYSTLNKYL